MQCVQCEMSLRQSNVCMCMLLPFPCARALLFPVSGLSSSGTVVAVRIPQPAEPPPWPFPFTAPALIAQPSQSRNDTQINAFTSAQPSHIRTSTAHIMSADPHHAAAASSSSAAAAAASSSRAAPTMMDDEEGEVRGEKRGTATTCATA